MLGVLESAWQTPAKAGWAGLVWLAVGAVGLVLVAALLVGEVGGGRGLAPLDEPARWSFHPDLDRARSVEPAPGGGVWVGTSVGALVRWGADGGDYRHHLPEAMAGRPVDALAVAPDGTVWAGTQGGAHPRSGVSVSAVVDSLCLVVVQAHVVAGEHQLAVVDVERVDARERAQIRLL